MHRMIPQQELKTCEDRFEQLTAIIQEGSLVVKPGGEVLFANQTAQTRFGICTGDHLHLPPFINEGEQETTYTQLHTTHADGTRTSFSANLSVRLSSWEGELAFLVLLSDRGETFGEADGAARKEDRNRIVLDQQIDVVFRYRPDGTITYANSAACRFFGYRVEELIGSTVLGLTPRSRHETLLNHIRSLVQAPRMVMDEYQFIAAGGQLRWLQVTNHVITAPSGQAVEVQCVGRDVSERKTTEEATRISEAHYRELIEENPALICRYQPDGSLTYVNDTFCQYFDKPRDELVGLKIIEMIIPDQREQAEKALTLLDPLVPRSTQETQVMASGEVRWLRWSNRTLLDNQGQFIEYLAVGVDISEAKKVEDALRQSEQRFREMLENIHLIAVMLDMDGRVQFVNDFFLALTGYERRDVVGRNWFDIMLLPQDQKRVRLHFERAVVDGTSIPYGENLIITRSGERRLVGWNTTLLRGADGRPYGVATIGEDITERAWANKVQEILHRISQGAITARSMDDLYRLIHYSLEEVMPVENFFIALHDPQRDQISYPYFIDEYDETPAPSHAEHGLTEYVLRTGRPLLASPEVFEDLVNRKEVESLGAPSVDWLGVPLKTGTRTIGVMVVQSYTDGVRFGGRDLRIMDFVSTQIALTIERKRAEQALRDNEEKYRALVEAASNAIFLETVEGQILDCNSAACQLFGYTKDELSRLSVVDLVPEIIVSSLPDIIEIERTQGGHHFETLNRRKDGSIFPVDVSTRLVDIGGETLTVVFVTDITQRKRREREMEAIAGVSAALRTAITQADLLPVILQQLVDRLSVHGAFICLREKDNNLMKVELGCGTWRELSGRSLPSRRTICCDVIESGKMYINNRVLDEDGFPFPEMIDGVKSLASVPLIAQGHIFGVLTVGYERPIQSDELHILTAITDIAASAIQRARLYEQTSRQAAELSEAYDATIEGWALALELRDKETQGHSRRVTGMTLKLAAALGIHEAELVHIRRGVLLHDIGKMGIPDSILLKPGPLTEDEWVTMRKHPEYAYKMLSSIGYLGPALDIPYCHHERWDGSGYPRGLKGEDIPLYARIFAVADVMEALTSDRPYRPAWSPEEARRHIHNQSGKHFDPRIVEVFLSTDAEK